MKRHLGLADRLASLPSSTLPTEAAWLMKNDVVGEQAGPSLSDLRAGTTRWNLALINGPNMSNLGERDTRTYGTIGSLSELEGLACTVAAGLHLSLLCFASNQEGAILEFIHETQDTVDGYLINPGGLWGGWPGPPERHSRTLIVPFWRCILPISRRVASRRCSARQQLGRSWACVNTATSQVWSA